MSLLDTNFFYPVTYFIGGGDIHLLVNFTPLQKGVYCINNETELLVL